MKIVMTLLVRDEQDIIRENIEYHLSQGVDHIIATDNKSVDSTADILKEYEAGGVLKYIFEGGDDYSQYKWVTRMARMACLECGADWVINNDADEFWWPRYGSLKDVFANVPDEYNVVNARRTNFVLTTNDGRPFYQRMIYREAVSLNSLGNPLPQKVAHRSSPMVEVAQGNHRVAVIGDVSALHDQVEILHFPVRSYKQILNKIIKGGAAYDRNVDLGKAVGNTWRKLYEEYKKDSNVLSYYADQFHPDDRINSRLSHNEILKDCRLRDYLDGLLG